MSIHLRQAMRQQLGDLRYETTGKWVRALVGDTTVADTTNARLVWEPRRVVPSYAVPRADLRADLVPVPAVGADGRAVLHPGVPFAAHSTAGESFNLRIAGRELPQAAFRPADADLADHIVLDFTAFDTWYEEDVPLVGHPRDPYHRVDIRRSSRHLRLELDGRVLAETRRPTLVFETSLPIRYYLPRDDVKVDLRPSPRRTTCAYKGEASYWSIDGQENLVWAYEHPLAEARELAGLVAFYDERVQVTVERGGDGVVDADMRAALAEEAATP
ncbi:MAG: DUF427 domain-containing protein [Kineosporiaceae bacterium]